MRAITVSSRSTFFSILSRVLSRPVSQRLGAVTMTVAVISVVIGASSAWANSDPASPPLAPLPLWTQPDPAAPPAPITSISDQILPLPGTPLSRTSPGLSLRTHAQAAREVDPQFLASRASLDAAEQGLALADSARGPKVSLSATTFRTQRTEESRNFLGQRIQANNDFSSNNVQIQARQPIYRFRDQVGISQAEAQLEAARALSMYAEQELHFRLVSRWVEVLAAREQVRVGEAVLAASIESLTEVERRFRGGDSTLQEVQQVRARTVQSEALLTDAKAQLDIAELNLRETVGPEAVIPQTLSIKGLAGLAFARLSTDALFSRIEERNFEIMSSRFQEEAARLEREKASSDRRPTLDAYVTLMKGNSDTLSSVKDENRIGLQLSVPLYTHGAIGASVAQADANYRRAQAQTRAVMMRLRSEALSANGSLESLTVRVAAIDRAADAAAISLRAQQQALRAGVASRAEVAQATQDMLSISRQQVQIRREFVSTWLKLQQIVSGFDDAVLDQIEARLTMR